MPRKKQPDWNQSLLDACHYNELDNALQALANGANPDSCDPRRGQTALMYAAGHGNLDLLDTLLLAGADPNAGSTDSGYEGWTALMYAAESWSTTAPDMIARLTAAGADPDRQNTRGSTALHIACDQGDRCLPVVEALLAAGAATDRTDTHGITPLHLAEMRESTSITARLQAAAAPRHALPAAELSEAIENRDRLTVYRLIADGVDINTPVGNAAALNRAAATGDLPILQALLTAGAHVNQPEPIGRWTPLMRAAYYGHAACVTQLLQAGADPAPQNDDGYTALALAQLGQIDALAPAGAYLTITTQLSDS